MNKLFYKILISFFILFVNTCHAQGNILLVCEGSTFLEFDLIATFYRKDQKTYELNKWELIIIKNDIIKKYTPQVNNQNSLTYNIPEDLGHLSKNYYLEFDRISGRVKERFATYPDKGYWKFEGICQETKRKF
jgi:hypothetical protein